MKKTYEKQLLVELETKRDAVQNRLDYMLSEGYFSHEMQSLENEWNRLSDRINDLRSELNEQK